jgi:hypothetical protein
MIPHLLRCRGFAVDDYSFTLGRLGSGATSTFARLGFHIRGPKNITIEKGETFEKCSFLFEFKEGENFNQRNTLSISRIKI